MKGRGTTPRFPGRRPLPVALTGILLVSRFICSIILSLAVISSHLYELASSTQIWAKSFIVFYGRLSCGYISFTLYFSPVPIRSLAHPYSSAQRQCVIRAIMASFSSSLLHLLMSLIQSAPQSRLLVRVGTLLCLIRH